MDPLVKQELDLLRSRMRELELRLENRPREAPPAQHYSLSDYLPDRTLDDVDLYLG